MKPKKKAPEKTSFPGFSPTVGIMLIIVVALIVAGGLYYLSTKTKTTNTSTTTLIQTNRYANGNANINTKAKTVTTPDGVISLTCQQESDCTVIDYTREYSVCCLAPSCPNNNREEYISVNQKSFSEVVSLAKVEKNCQGSCPEYVSPLCPVNEMPLFQSVCMRDSCLKVDNFGEGDNKNTNSNANLNVNANANSSVNNNTNTAGWQTYSNDDIGISFQYPEAWGPVTVETEDLASYGDTGKGVLVGFSGAGETSFKSKVQLRYTTSDFAPGREVWFGDVVGYVNDVVGLQNVCVASNLAKIYLGGISNCTTELVGEKWRTSFSGQINSLDGEEVLNFVKVYAFETGDAEYPAAAISIFLTGVNEPAVRVSDSAGAQRVYSSIANKTADAETNSMLTNFDRMIESLQFTR